MDFNSLIGLEENQARFLLSENGYKNIKTIINAKDDENCNKTIVCLAKYKDNIVTLICSKFYVI